LDLVRRFFGKEVRMVKKEEKKEGMVRDLIEKKKRGEITSKEAYKEIYRRGLQHGKDSSQITVLTMLVGGILCFITLIAKITHLPMLEPLTQLPAISFPPIIRYSAVIFILLSIIVMFHTAFLRAKKGGCGWKGESETIMLVADGAYGIVRHPAHLCCVVILLSFTLILSEGVPFTILAVIGNILVFAAFYYSSIEEEELNILKWGDEYRQYMKEVPRFNFILGIWRWTRKRK